MPTKRVEAFQIAARIEVDNRRAQASLRDTEKQAGKTAGVLGKLKGVIGGVDKVAGGVSGGGLLGGVGEALKLLPGLGTLATGLGKVVDVGQSAVSLGFDFNRVMEEGRIAFEVLLKDHNKAKQLLSGLDRMSVDSPFDFSELVDTTPTLLAFQFRMEEITRVMTAAGDASRGQKEKFDGIILSLGQMKVKGKVSAEEMLQLVERGVPAWKYLGDEIAKVDKQFAKLGEEERLAAVQKMAERGLISSKGAVEAILRGIEDEFGGLGKRVANETASGLESQMRDAAARTLGPASKGLFEGYKGALRLGIRTVGSETVQGLAEGIGNGAHQGVEAVQKLADDLIKAIKSPAGLDINSPSKKFIPIGESAAEGLAAGFASGLDRHAAEMFRAVDSQLGEMEGLLSQRRGRGRAVSPRVTAHDSIIEEMAAKYGLDPNLIRAMMQQESGGKRGAVSHKGASGLMQLMPGTARRFGVTNIFDPRQNIEGGARYLRFLMDRFKGDLDLVLAGYNAGEGAVAKYGGRVPPYAETQHYVRAIKGIYGQLSGGAFDALPVRVVGGDGAAAQTFGASSPHQEAELKRLIREREDYVAETVRKRTLNIQSRHWAESQLPGATDLPTHTRLVQIAHASEEAVREIDRQAAEFLRDIDARIAAARAQVRRTPFAEEERVEFVKRPVFENGRLAGYDASDPRDLGLGDGGPVDVRVVDGRAILKGFVDEFAPVKEEFAALATEISEIPFIPVPGDDSPHTVGGKAGDRGPIKGLVRSKKGRFRFDVAGQQPEERDADGDGEADKVNGAVFGLKAAGKEVKNLFKDGFSDFAQGIGGMVEDFVLLGETGPGAMKKLVASVLAGVAAQSAVLAVFELAKGFASLFFNPAEAASHFTAAALFGSIAGVTAVAGRKVAGDSFKDEPDEQTQQQQHEAYADPANPANQITRRWNGGPGYQGRAYIVGDGGRAEVFEPEEDGYIHPSVDAYERSRAIRRKQRQLERGGLRGMEKLLHRALGRLADQLERMESMPPGEVVRLGAPKAKKEIAGAFIGALDSHHKLVDQTNRRLRP